MVNSFEIAGKNINLKAVNEKTKVIFVDKHIVLNFKKVKTDD
jgi:hypothetical protein